MINERGRLIWRRMRAGDGYWCGARGAHVQAAGDEKDAMTNGMTALMLAVGGSSLACYWLMTRVQSAAACRSNATSDNSGYSSGGTYDSGGGWNVFNWFSSDSSSSDKSSASDSSSSSDSGGGDSGGGSDGGGGSD
jgi:hypothetical protein